MPYCNNCGKAQSKFKNNGVLCGPCTDGQSTSQNVQRKITTNDSGTHEVTKSNETPSAVTTPSDVNKKVGDMSINELLSVFQNTMKPIENKIDAINKTLSNEVQALQKKVEILEQEDSAKEQKISRLTDTINNMQQAINAIDSKERAKNLIIAGLTENPIQLEESLLTDDYEKIRVLLDKIGLHQSVYSAIISVERIGKESSEKRRMLKVVLGDNTTRETIISHAKNLKDLEEPWKKIFINRDTHPVYNKEHQRLRKKFNEMKKRPDLKTPGSVTLKKGKLIVNGVTIDQNIFLK